MLRASSQALAQLAPARGAGEGPLDGRRQARQMILEDVVHGAGVRDAHGRLLVDHVRQGDHGRVGGFADDRAQGLGTAVPGRIEVHDDEAPLALGERAPQAGLVLHAKHVRLDAGPGETARHRLHVRLDIFHEQDLRHQGQSMPSRKRRVHAALCRVTLHVNAFPANAPSYTDAACEASVVLALSLAREVARARAEEPRAR